MGRRSGMGCERLRDEDGARGGAWAATPPEDLRSQDLCRCGHRPLTLPQHLGQRYEPLYW